MLSMKEIQRNVLVDQANVAMLAKFFASGAISVSQLLPFWWLILPTEPG